MDFNNKKALVVGTGISGIAATKLLVEHKVKVLLYDENPNISIEKVVGKLNKDSPVEVQAGGLSDAVIKGLDFAVVSPGVPMDCDLAVRLRKESVPIWGEIELAYVFDKGTVIAITGTNGKTTTTALTGEIMKGIRPSVFVVGNIGIPYTEVVGKTTEESITVAEVSSFQLETIHTFCPQVSAILNVTPDHLDRHHTMEAYVAAKKWIAKNQTPEQTCVLNYEDPILRNVAGEISANVLYFSSKRELREGVYLDGNGDIVYQCAKGANVVCNISELKILGVHSYENAMAGIAMGVSMNVPIKQIREAVIRFQAIEHRIECVANIRGVTYYNDSKATNTDAAIKGIRAMVSPTWLIGGGYDKEAEYDEWIASFDGKVKKLVLFGSTKEKIADTAKKRNFLDFVFVNDLEEAVRYCKENAENGDAVLLSPACASWDMFRNYEERGNRFKEYVKAGE